MGRYSTARSMIPGTRFGFASAGMLSNLKPGYDSSDSGIVAGENAKKRYIAILSGTTSATGGMQFTQGQTRLATIDFASVQTIGVVKIRASTTTKSPTIAGGTVTFQFATTYASKRVGALVIGRSDPLRIFT